MFIYYMQNKYFFFFQEEGRLMLEQASNAGNRDATFALAMMMMAEGGARKQQALNLLNSAYPQTPQRTDDVVEIVERVQTFLERDAWMRKDIHFHSDHLPCPVHPAWFRELGFDMLDNTIFGCDVCLWAACFRKFGRIFGKNDVDHDDMYGMEIWDN
jgi:hypothetical protein